MNHGSQRGLCLGKIKHDKIGDNDKTHLDQGADWPILITTQLVVYNSW